MSYLLSHTNFKDFMSKLFQARLQIGIYKITCATCSRALSGYVPHILHTLSCLTCLVPHVPRALNAPLLHVHCILRVFVTHMLPTPHVVMLLVSLAPILSCALYVHCANIIFCAFIFPRLRCLLFYSFSTYDFLFLKFTAVETKLHIGNYLM